METLENSNILFINKPPEIVGYWTYAKNKELAKGSTDIRVLLPNVPPKRTRMLLSLFGIYWIEIKSKK